LGPAFSYCSFTLSCLFISLLHGCTIGCSVLIRLSFDGLIPRAYCSILDHSPSTYFGLFVSPFSLISLLGGTHVRVLAKGSLARRRSACSQEGEQCLWRSRRTTAQCKMMLAACGIGDSDCFYS
jgi:hypothetical protein